MDGHISHLTIVKLNIDTMSDRTDIVKFIQGGGENLENFLETAKGIVHNRYELSRNVKRYCAFDICTDWRKVADYVPQTPAEAATITHWQQDIRSEINIDYYLSMADSTFKKYSQLISRIESAWGMHINIAIPQELIPPIGELSKSLIQKLAQLAECISHEQATALLKENVSKRTGRLTRTARTRTSPYLMSSDVSSALEQSISKGRKASKTGKRPSTEPADITIKKPIKKPKRASMMTKYATASSESDHEPAVITPRKKRKLASIPDQTLASNTVTSRNSEYKLALTKDQALADNAVTSTKSDYDQAPTTIKKRKLAPITDQKMASDTVTSSKSDYEPASITGKMQKLASILDQKVVSNTITSSELDYELAPITMKKRKLASIPDPTLATDAVISTTGTEHASGEGNPTSGHEESEEHNQGDGHRLGSHTERETSVSGSRIRRTSR